MSDNSTISFDPDRPKSEKNYYTGLLGFGLSQSVIDYYVDKGITKLFGWQKECLQLTDVFNGHKNLVYSAPTSAGKSLVADIMMFQTLMRQKLKVIVVLPYVSIVHERVNCLKFLFRRIGLQMDAFAGSSNPRGGLSRTNMAVCTIEKANSMINKLIEEGKVSQLGLVIVDELQMLSHPSRGYLIELILSKINYMRKYLDSNVRVVGMSAALSNLQDIGDWLEGATYLTDYRPVELREYVVCGDVVMLVNRRSDSKKLKLHKEGPLAGPYQLGFNQEYNTLAFLTCETMYENNAVLIFCQTKTMCETVAAKLAMYIRELIGAKNARCLKKYYQDFFRSAYIRQKNAIASLIATLKRTHAGLDANLQYLVQFGIGYHHAGLVTEQRAALEQAFREGLIKVLFSTTTLSAGVNLPARRVMIVTPYDHANRILETSDYLQMIGRTGRKGLHTEGESYLFCLPKELDDVHKMLASEPKPIHSSLKVFENAAQVFEKYELIQKKDKKSKFDDPKESNMINDHVNIMFCTVMEVLSNGLIVTLQDLLKYFGCTFLASKLSETTIRENVLHTLHALIKNRMVEVKHEDFNIPLEEISPDLTHNMAEDTRLSVTTLGKAIISSHIKPTESNFILKELRKCQKNCCLSNDLHLIYETTPMNIISKSLKIDWNAYYTMYRGLNEDMRHAAELIGIKEYFFIEMISGMNSPANTEILTTHKRFYVSLALLELIQEVPMNTVKNKYQISKGNLQALQYQASTFAGMLAIFCNHMGWSTMELLIDNFQPRLNFGIQRELIDLVRLPNISASIARQLYSHGFDTVIKLINCKPIEIAQVLVGKNSPLIKNDDRLTHSETQLFGFKVFLQSVDTYITIEDFSRKIIMDARMLVESDIGHPLNLDPICDDPLIPQQQPVTPPIGPFGLDIEPPVLRPGPYGTLQRYTPYWKQEITPEEFSRQPLKALVSSQGSGSSQSEASGSQQRSDELSQPGPSGTQMRPVASQPKQSSSGGQKPGESQTHCEKGPSSSSTGTSELKKDSTPQKSAQRSSTPIKADESGKSTDVDQSMSLSFGDESLLEEVVKVQEQQQQQQGSGKESIPGAAQANSSNEAKKRSLASTDDHTLDASTGKVMLKQSTSSSSISIATMSIDSDENLSFSGDKSDPGPSKAKIAKLSIQKDVHEELKSSELAKPSTSAQNNSSIDAVDSSTLSQSVSSDESSFFNYEHVNNLLEFVTREKKPMPFQFQNEPKVDKSNTLWVRANNVEECKTMLRTLFQKIGKTANVKRVVHSIYFRLKTHPKNEKPKAVDEQDLEKNRSERETEDVPVDDAIENSYYLPLKNSDQAVHGVYIKRYGCPHVYWVYGKSALNYLREHWFQAVSYFVSRQTSTKDSRKTDGQINRKLRMVTYDMKQSLHCLYEVFKFDRKLLLEKIDWWDAETALWMMDPDSEKIDIDKISLPQLKQVMIEHGFDVNQYNRIWDINNPAIPRLTCKPYILKYAKIFDTVHRAIKVMMLYNFVWLCLRALNNVNLLESYFLIEIPARVCVFIIETNPIRVDVCYLNCLEDLMFQFLRTIENQIFRDAGLRFSVGDPKQVAQALYSNCNLISNYFNVTNSPKAPRKVVSMRKAPIKLTKHLGTSKNALLKLQEACGTRTRLPTMVIEWRKLEFSITNSVRAIREHCKINPKEYRGFIYSKFNEWTSTGRIMMHEPNLISFPKDFPLTTLPNETGIASANEEPVIVKIRKLLISKSKHVFVAADYCQLELRIMAHLSQDFNLMNTLKDVEKDIFKSIAADWKNIAYEDVSNDERQQAKQVCYGIIYGMGDESLAEKLSITLDEARNLKMAFFERYPNVSRFIEDSIEKCARLGHVRTLMGRQRPIKNIGNDSNISQYNHACRQAVNSRIQGSAADLFKVAMIKVQKKIFKNGWDQIQLCLQMHDELMFQVPKKECNKFAEFLKKTMQKISKLIDIPLPVKIFVGRNWSEMEELVNTDKTETTPSHISETSDDSYSNDDEDEEDSDGSENGSGSFMHQPLDISSGFFRFN